MSALPDHAAYRARWSALHGGYDPSASVVADSWMRLIEAAARPLARRGVSADVITGSGLAAAGMATIGAYAGGRWRFAAAGAVTAAGIADALDGSVAALSGEPTAWGYVLDSMADRAADALNLLALRAAGAPTWLTAAASAGTAALEYGRARAGAAGFRDVGVVTAGERPMRVIAAAAGLAASALLPARSAVPAALAAATITGLSTVGAGQFLRHAAKALRGVQAVPIRPATARAESATSGSPPPG